MYEILIQGGMILDGTGNPWYQGDVGIAGGRITALDRIGETEAQETVDARGLAVCPGFIDMHSHSDLDLLVNPLAEPKIRQGVTTELIGQDGVGPAPIGPSMKASWKRTISGITGHGNLEWEWDSFSSYLDHLDSAATAVNVASLLPQGNMRLSVAGVDPSELTPSQLAQARSGVEEAMAEGAFGLSTGLIYVPCMYSTTDELTALCQVMGGSGRPLVIHVRNEGSLLLESLREAALIASEAGVPFHVSHFKASGRPNWDKVPSALAFLEERRAEGQDVTFDQYPYTAGSTTMLALLPPWMLQGGPDELHTRLQDPELREQARQEIEEGHQALGWDNMAHNAGWDGILVTAVASEANRPLEGRSVTEIAELRGTAPAEAVFDLLHEEDGSVSMVIFSMCEESVRRIMQHPYHMVGTDGLMGGKPHPRMGGTYPRILGRYVREEGVLTLPDAVRRMTSLPAQRLGLRDRGLVREGHWADLVVFDPDSVIDGNSYADPLRPPRGIHHVLVNGTPVLRGGEPTSQRPGRVLRA